MRLTAVYRASVNSGIKALYRSARLFSENKLYRKCQNCSISASKREFSCFGVLDLLTKNKVTKTIIYSSRSLLYWTVWLTVPKITELGNDVLFRTGLYRTSVKIMCIVPTTIFGIKFVTPELNYTSSFH